MAINDLPAVTAAPQGIDTAEPGSDGWWLKRLYEKLRVQQKECDALQRRYEGNAPLPFISAIQRDAVKWFVEKSRTNFESVIVDAVLSKLRIRGVRTAVDSDEGGDAEAMKTWRATRGPLWSRDAMKMALVMKLAAVIVGKDADGNLLVTAEDPRLVVWISDPADPYKVLAALKLFYDDVAEADVAYLYLPGRLRVAKRSRKRAPGSSDVKFNPSAYTWDDTIVDAAGGIVYAGQSGPIDWLQQSTEAGPAVVPLVPYYNENNLGEFEPYIQQIDRINQQILQRMTIATIQAFKQRAIKGAPRKDPDTGEDIDYDKVFTADPGAIWLLPDTADIWESGVVDLTPILAAIRDDVKDLYGTSGTPSYLATPDAANASAESAALQREMNNFKVDARKDRYGPSHESTWSLMFRTLGDAVRSKPGTVQVLWAPTERLSMSEKASAVAQTRGVVPRYMQLTDIMGYDPDEATRALTLLHEDMVLDQQMALAAAAAAAPPAGIAGPPDRPALPPGAGSGAAA